MSVPVANEDLTLDHGALSPISGGTFTVQSVPSPFVKAEGKGVYSQQLLYIFSNGNASGFVDGSVASVGPQTIPATAVFCKEGGKLVMREGDFGTMSCSGTLTAGGTGTVAGPVEISDAGQTNTKGD